MNIRELNNYVAGILDLTIPDMGLNGIQVDSTGSIKKIITAVDFSEELLTHGVKQQADAMIVHHGMYWGQLFPVTGRYYRLIKGLIENNIGLLAYHLPLDVHPTLGNNALLLASLGIKNQESFGDYKGVEVIMAGEVKSDITWDNFLANFLERVGKPVAVIANNYASVKKVGICTGGGLFGIEEAKYRGCDTYITGDANHTSYHLARELDVRLISGGHYNTEVWGVRALGERIAKDCGVTAKFIDIPTGL